MTDYKEHDDSCQKQNAKVQHNYEQKIKQERTNINLTMNECNPCEHRRLLAPKLYDRCARTKKYEKANERKWKKVTQERKWEGGEPFRKKRKCTWRAG